MDARILGDLLIQLQRLRRHEHWSRDQLARYQGTTLRTLRARTYSHSPFYKRFHRGLTDHPLQELPILTKATMMEHFDELVTDRAIHLEDVRAHAARVRGDEQYLDRYWVTATSGSTGHPGFFLFARSEWTAVLASFARAREWAGMRVNLARRVKTAVLSTTMPLHMSARVGTTLESWWMPTLRLNATGPLDALVEQLNAGPPEVLIAYASMARLLAEEQLGGHLHIAPRRVLTSSEVLTADTRRRVERAWGDVLFNQYATTESGSLGAECTHHHGMHLFDDLVIVETVDQDNQPVPPGVYGEKLLLTVLFNRTQPLIRYELGDSLRLATAPCACGSPFLLIDDIQGRMEDELHLPAFSGGMVVVHPNVFHNVMDTAPVREW